MPIYEYYSPDTLKIYSFYAKTLAQGQRVPRCPDNPHARMVKLLSAFAIGGAKKADETGDANPAGGADAADEARIEAAMGAMEREFANADENDPRAMARMMRRMAELSGEKLDDPMEEVVRKLEEGADPESVESELGEVFGGEENAEAFTAGSNAPEATSDETPQWRPRFKARRRPAPTRDPKLYDYE